MTVYGSPRRRRLRPTLRVRLALITGAVLGIVALVLVILAATIGRHRVATDILAIAVIAVAGVAAGYIVVARALRPLQQVTATARRLSGETLDQRINYAGVDDEVGTRGTVVFQVWGDATKLYDSGTLTGSSPTATASVDVSGRTVLRLVVTDADGDPSYDHGDWAAIVNLNGSALAVSRRTGSWLAYGDDQKAVKAGRRYEFTGIKDVLPGVTRVLQEKTRRLERAEIKTNEETI